ncbi:porphobilinogen synthase [Shewanella putrefaciens]|uniref:Delta-aminolevulinic acid dehydratase n=1 Tax=Shewanella putrefaciens TaxID=24 RepID=A0ABX8XFR1_SHEPU|nr:porphobilinogen synthase [Shewanella putrefaciens]AVV82568.1 delta-aminolevulinic acid dehydratase [Shewanella putrefaciens]MCT8941934.1 porphobilinogen synthase [Shewanella putrefaciens]QSE51000.1 porphobilinogen synthase [Shewanella putrefaciens]QYX74411.1 porphobilinogen synthase [Shewanella putrefaciens]GGN16745.1 delta-aminolevulinic acid dehydratase [Shewanella putrefaciens]
MLNTPPLRRLRRLRSSEAMRDLLRETQISLSDLIHPLFIEEQINHAIPISTLPGISRLPESALADEVRELYALGIRYVMPFGISHTKDDKGSDTWDDNGLLARMVRAIKTAVPEMMVIPDICFCEYTYHGHCGVVHNNEVCNDLTVENLVKQSVTAAKAGADMLAPSAMMDGQVKAIRQGLDAAGFEHVAILAHSAKFASSFYGPFRAAVDCELSGNRKGYQLDYANGRQALLEALLDEAEGADILMVKPGTPYLDVLSRLRQETHLPLAAYQVGGEYAGIKFAALAGALDERAVVTETFIGLKRAGADLIVSYYTKQYAQWLAENHQ